MSLPSPFSAIMMVMFGFFGQKQTILNATKAEQHDAIDRLINQGKLGSGYYLILFLAVLIVTPGLLINNAAVIIGGMLLAPLMIPLLLLSLSLVSGSTRGLLRAFKILVFSIVITIFTAAGITVVFQEAFDVVHWIPSTIDPGIYIFIAFCSGVAGTFAWVKENLSTSIAGVAVAVSLLPPLCAVGMALPLSDWELMQNSLILFAANLVGICLAGFLVFWFLGFLNVGHVEDKVIKKSDA